MGARYPFPAFPDGWFAACFSSELPLGKVLSKKLFGRELVVFRTESGRAAVLDAYCPHMGAHLGKGGRVVQETVQCPMHAFRFDVNGACVATGYGTKPPVRCTAPSLHVLEIDGAVLVHHDHAGRAPTWQPETAGIGAGGRVFTHVYRNLPSHPQETTENSVDLGHLGVVHGYENVQVLAPVQTDGPLLTARYAFERRPIVRGTPRVRAEFTAKVWGLGVSQVDVNVISHGIRTQHLVLSAPTDGEHVDLHLAATIHPRALPFRLLPRVVLDHTLGLGVFLGFLADVRQDFHVWTHKRYVHPPALAKGDGPIGAYRRWASQFYREGAALAAE